MFTGAPNAIKQEILVDWTEPVLEGELFYSDATIREWYTKEELIKHYETQEKIIAAEKAHDPAPTLAKAAEEKAWAEPAVKV